MLRYLGAYTHRVAISNHRLVSLQDHEVTFRWRDSAHKNKKRLLTLQLDEFLRRFLVWSKYSNVLKPWVMSPRERLWENVTRQIWTA